LRIETLASDLSFPKYFIGNPVAFQFTASGFPLKDCGNDVLFVFIYNAIYNKFILEIPCCLCVGEYSFLGILHGMLSVKGEAVYIIKGIAASMSKHFISIILDGLLSALNVFASSCISENIVNRLIFGASINAPGKNCILNHLNKSVASYFFQRCCNMWVLEHWICGCGRIIQVA
jgi:hypothetical protein